MPQPSTQLLAALASLHWGGAMILLLVAAWFYFVEERRKARRLVWAMNILVAVGLGLFVWAMFILFS